MMEILAELDNVKGVGLIERVRQGQGKPAIIYVRKFIGTAEVLTTEKPTLIRMIVIILNLIILTVTIPIPFLSLP